MLLPCLACMHGTSLLPRLGAVHVRRQRGGVAGFDAGVPFAGQVGYFWLLWHSVG